MVLDTSKHPWLCAEHGARTVESQHVGMVSYHVCVCNGRGENSGDDPVGCEGPRRRCFAAGAKACASEAGEWPGEQGRRQRDGMPAVHRWQRP